MVSRDFFFFFFHPRNSGEEKRFRNFFQLSRRELVSPFSFFVVVFISSGIRILIFQIFYKFVRRDVNITATILVFLYFISSHQLDYRKLV